jgi:hypothetical protein
MLANGSTAIEGCRSAGKVEARSRAAFSSAMLWKRSAFEWQLHLSNAQLLATCQWACRARRKVARACRWYSTQMSKLPADSPSQTLKITICFHRRLRRFRYPASGPRVL